MPRQRKQGVALPPLALVANDQLIIPLISCKTDVEKSERQVQETMPLALVWWQYALCGAFGGILLDGFEIYELVKEDGSWPENRKTSHFFIAEILRITMGAGLAVVLGISGAVTGPVGAVGVGVAAPLIVKRLGSAAAADATKASLEPEDTQKRKDGQ